MKTIKDYRIKRLVNNITLTEIAKNIGCSIALISMYESEKANMSDQKIMKYRKYIDEY